MIDEKKVKQALGVYLKNEYWREYYENAPSILCGRYIELEFADGMYDDSKINKERRSMYDVLGLEDWIYLKKYAGHNPFYARCEKMIKQLSKG